MTEKTIKRAQAPTRAESSSPSAPIATPNAVPALTRKPPSQVALKIAARRKAARQAGLLFESPDDVICGVDEAGRGPLAGPVVAAAVILDPARPIRGLNDSKMLTAQAREKLYDRIVERSLAWSVASASVEEIDTLNILHATMLAMRRAVEGLSVAPTLAKIDGNRCPVMPVRSEAVIGGDALVPSISAASIIAKVTRDRMLTQLHETFPHYGFDAHAGYGTPQHLAALREHGPCEHHRRSFAPVREAYALHGVVLPGVATVVSDVAALEDDAVGPDDDAFMPA
ncbi:ribonuclease HII [Paraburkholderia tagetis]|uniref:Ribonuclease HII n=1 Tax=Paraburkholderia tagetis TaxID=2913261 RepID=A0A9X1RQ07_9BURK|nr:ribonuclease HII [Paraburkholderia tagetis]MCG5073577.1 ribonuclease HII [Paraburkholderia tagetis]